MAAKIALVPFSICVLLVTQLLLLRAAAAVTAVTIPTGGGAAPPSAAATLGGGLPKLPFPFPADGTAHGLPKLRFPFPGEGTARGLPQLPFPFPGEGTARGLPQLPFPLPGGAAPAAGCLKAVHQAESCVGDVLRSLATPPGHVGAACCGALQAVGDACFRGVLPVSPFRTLYAPLVKQACRLSMSLMPGPRV